MPYRTDLLRDPLELLLSDLFDATGLRRYLKNGPEGDVITAELPITGTMRDVTHAAVDVLMRRGLIDIALFDRLCVEFPARAQEIRWLCGQWIVSRGHDGGAVDGTVAGPIDQLEEAYRVREHCIVLGTDTRAVDLEILELRRIIRRGPQLHSGESLLAGRYRLAAELGSGGFATVWRAYDRETRDLVAVKVLHGQWARDHTHRERFARGARTMMRLNHPNIVRVLREPYDDDGFHFYVMDLVEGECLHHAVLDGRIDLARTISGLLGICDALGFAHDRGYVHRDVKPANVLIDRKGRTYLTDFDLIRGKDTTGGTRTGAGMGTAAFAAPEAQSDASRAGPMADIYSVGMTLLFAALGRALDVDDICDLRNHELTTPPEVNRVIYRATAKYPDRRYGNMAALRADLKRILADRNEEQTVIRLPPRRKPVPDAAEGGETGPAVIAALPHLSQATEGAVEHTLLCILGPEFGRRYQLGGKPMTIGRASASDIRINEDAVSRRHAVLTVEAGRVRLRDAMSSNGTFVNDERVHERWLSPGDSIKVSRAMFKLLSGTNVEELYQREINHLRTIDGLTQLINCRSFTEGLEKERIRAQHHGRPVSLILLDIDHFYQFNEKYGPDAGDVVLRELGAVIRDIVRKGDVLARYGGDAFAVLMSSASVTAAAAFAEQLRVTVADMAFAVAGREVPLTISLGVVGLVAADETYEEVLDRAEAQLHAAKGAGRNRVMVDGPPHRLR